MIYDQEFELIVLDVREAEKKTDENLRFDRIPAGFKQGLNVNIQDPTMARSALGDTNFTRALS